MLRSTGLWECIVLPPPRPPLNYSSDRRSLMHSRAPRPHTLHPRTQEGARELGGWSDHRIPLPTGTDGSAKGLWANQGQLEAVIPWLRLLRDSRSFLPGFTMRSQESDTADNSPPWGASKLHPWGRQSGTKRQKQRKTTKINKQNLSLDKVIWPLTLAS